MIVKKLTTYSLIINLILATGLYYSSTWANTERPGSGVQNNQGSLFELPTKANSKKQVTERLRHDVGIAGSDNCDLFSDSFLSDNADNVAWLTYAKAQERVEHERRKIMYGEMRS
tara:strand:+ start:2041 stop:2385 length:345 start_codon:yes stop_codon:yes gene_type:complete